METLTLNIKGMTCGGCVKSVTNVLQPIKGVSSVDVSRQQNRAINKYDPAYAQFEQFKSAVENAGYEVI